MVRPAQASLIAKKLGDIPIVACAHKSYLKRAGTPRVPADLLAAPPLIGYDKDDPHPARRGPDGPAAHARALCAAHRRPGGLRPAHRRRRRHRLCGRYNLRHWRGVVPVLPGLAIPPLPCWLAVHREIRGSRVVRRVFEFLAEAIPRELAMA